MTLEFWKEVGFWYLWGILPAFIFTLYVTSANSIRHSRSGCTYWRDGKKYTGIMCGVMELRRDAWQIILVIVVWPILVWLMLYKLWESWHDEAGLPSDWPKLLWHRVIEAFKRTPKEVQEELKMTVASGSHYSKEFEEQCEETEQQLRDAEEAMRRERIAKDVYKPPPKPQPTPQKAKRKRRKPKKKKRRR